MRVSFALYWLGCMFAAKDYAEAGQLSSQARFRRTGIIILNFLCVLDFLNVLDSPRRHGRVLRFGRAAGSAGIARQAGGCRGTIGSAWRCHFRELRGAKIRDSIGDAAPHGGAIVSPRWISRVAGASL